jgi:predicted phage terminase large subunit-like protein
VTTLILDRPPGLTAEEAAQEARQALRARSHLLDFACYTMPTYERATHLEVVAGELEAIERGENDRLMVWLPPRHGKSELVSVRFPAWFEARNPSKSFITASYGGELASGFGRRARNVLAMARVREIFPDVSLAQDSKAANLWHTEQGGAFLAVGVGGGITGYGAHILNIDDPIKTRQEAESRTYRENVWQWYKSEAYTRLEPGGAIVLTLTRWHEDDLAGRLIAEMEAGGDRWRIIRLPALAEDGDPLERAKGAPLWPSRFDLEALERIRQTLGSRDWAALYQQRPAPEEGVIFKWWPRYDALPDGTTELLIGIDTAYTEGDRADATACAAWAVGMDGKLRLIEAASWQVETPQAERGLRWFYEALKARFPRVPVRPLVRKKVAIDRIMAQHLRIAGTPAITVDMPGGDKEVYAKMIAPEFEGERALIPSYAPWLEDWLKQHLDFPNGLHDDYVETTNVVLYYRSRRPAFKPQPGISIYPR